MTEKKVLDGERVLTPKEQEFFEKHGVLPENVDFITNSFTESVYSIYDVCSQFYDAPFISANDGTSVRIVQDTLLLRDNLIKRHPEDYQLFKVGYFNKSTGELLPLSSPKLIIRLKDLVSSVSGNNNS